MPGLKNIEYNEYPKSLNLPTLLFTLYKILYNYYNISLFNLVLKIKHKTRRHTHKLKKLNARINVKKNRLLQNYKLVEWFAIRYS